MFQAKDENNKKNAIKDDPNDTIGEERMYEQIGNPIESVGFIYEVYI
jgi:hypothetical protein